MTFRSEVAEMSKAELAAKIHKWMDQRPRTSTETAERLGLPMPDAISAFRLLAQSGQVRSESIQNGRVTIYWKI